MLEEELDSLEWQRQAPYIESSSYIVNSDGSGCLNAIGKEVAFILQGYYEQCRRLSEAQVGPFWTSFGLRRCLQLGQSGARGNYQHRDIASTPAGVVERCRVVSITYHRKAAQPSLERTGSQASAQTSERRSGDGTGASSSLSIMQPEPVSALTGDNNEAAGNNTDGFQPCDAESGDEGVFFVRVRLQRVAQPGDRSMPLCITVDNFVDIGVGEWIVPWEVYEKTAAKPWQVGDYIKMFWAEKGGRGYGQWFEGHVIGLVQHNAGDVYRDSPWATVSVRWLDSHNEEEYHENFISPWELLPAEEGSRSQSLAEDAQEESTDESADEDWIQSQRTSRQSCRKQRMHQVEPDSPVSSPCSRRKRAEGAAKDMDEDFSCWNSPKRRKRDDTGTAVTMAGRNCKANSNRDYCEVCKVWPMGETLVECDGSCLRSFHPSCLPESHRLTIDDDADNLWYCPDCSLGQAECAACLVKGTAGSEVFKCCIESCGQHFHPSCIRRLDSIKACCRVFRSEVPSTTFTLESRTWDFMCPAHFCTRCNVSDMALRMYRCWTCLGAVHEQCLDRQLEPCISEQEFQCKECTLDNEMECTDRSTTEEVAFGDGDSKRWICCLEDLQTGERLGLEGKDVFTLGAHTKGDGCDIVVPVKGVKVHTYLTVQHNGRVVASCCNWNAWHQATMTIIGKDGLSHELSPKAPIQLNDGDQLEILDFAYRLEQQSLPCA